MLEVEHSEEVEKFGRVGIVREIKVYAEVTRTHRSPGKELQQRAYIQVYKVFGYSGQGGQGTDQETWLQSVYSCG